MNTPHKSWKITEEDWRNREKWDDYNKAVNEMIFRTSREHSEWTIIEGNNKHFARIQVLKSHFCFRKSSLRTNKILTNC